MRDHSATSTSSWSARRVLTRIEIHQLGESEKAVPVRLEAADDVGDGRHGVGTIGLGESVRILTVVQQGDAARTDAVQYAALYDIRRGAVPVPGHHRPAHALHPQIPGHRDYLWAVPPVWHAEEARQGACGVVDGLLPPEQLIPDRARAAPREVWVGEGMVADLVQAGYLRGEVRLAH